MDIYLFLLCGVLLALVAFVVWRVRDARRVDAANARTFGFSTNEARSVRKDLERGDREKAIREIAALQERQRADILAREGIDVSSMTPEIGREIAWTDVIRQVFRVLEFDRAGTTIGSDDTVVATTIDKPYGYLLVESPIFNQPMRLPIVHRDDFWLAASVFDNAKLGEIFKDAELLVTFIPRDRLPGGMIGTSHALHYVFTNRGTLDRYYEIDEAVHMAEPKPELLFESFEWDGEIRVKVNFDLDI